MTGPAPEVAAQRTAVRRALSDLAPGAVVLVACSGGADSLALAAATAFVAPRAGLRAGAVVVDHGLQPGSGSVAAQAAATCRELGLDPVRVVRVDVRGGGGPEAAARDARHAALAGVADEVGAAAVLLGHTLDDQAETVLLGLARGSGARSLAGMPAVRGVLRRPFLGVRRAQTEAACAAQGLRPWHDPTNGAPGVPADDLPLRSRVRHDVLPVLADVLGPGVPEALARTAEMLAEDAEALEGAAQDLLDRATVDVDADADADRTDVGGHAGVVLDVEVLAGAPTAVRRRALRLAAVRAGAPDGALHRTHVLALDALVVEWHGQGPVSLPGGTRARRSCGRLTVGADAHGGAAGRRTSDTTGRPHDGSTRTADRE